VVARPEGEESRVLGALVDTDAVVAWAQIGDQTTIHAHDEMNPKAEPVPPSMLC
jgi:hypothetical protein